MPRSKNVACSEIRIINMHWNQSYANLALLSLAVLDTMACVCSFHFVNSSSCSSSTSSNFQSEIIPLSQCNNDCTNHLVALGVSENRGKGFSASLTEEELILNRSSLTKINEKERCRLTICPKHRVYLTWQWPGIKRKSCSYPTHTGKRTVSTARPRRVTRTLSQEIVEVFQESVPIGSGGFFNHAMLVYFAMSC